MMKDCTQSQNSLRDRIPKVRMHFQTRVIGWITWPIDQRTYDLSERLPMSEEYMGKASPSGHDTVEL